MYSVPAVKLNSVKLWPGPLNAASVRLLPYDVLVPYSINELAFSLVDHEMMALVSVMLEAKTLEIVGGVASPPPMLATVTSSNRALAL